MICNNHNCYRFVFYKWILINSTFAWFSPGFLKIWLIFNSISYILYIFLLREKLWKILKEMGIPDHLTCLLRNLYAGEEATVRTGHGTMDWFKTGKEVHQGCIFSPCLFNLYAEYVMWNARLDEAQAEIKMRGEISITSDMWMTPLWWQKAKRN